MGEYDDHFGLSIPLKPYKRHTNLLWKLTFVALAACLWSWERFAWIIAPSRSRPDFDWYALEPSEDINWTACFDGFKCARLSVPLDYQRPDGPKAVIAVQMLPATDRANYGGTILLNPGGPGGSGTWYVGKFGTKLAQVVGPQFDLLGFDPRGTGATLPRAECFTSESQSKIWELQHAPLLNLSDNSIPLARSREVVMSDLCLKAMGGNGNAGIGATVEEWGGGRYMGTASVATDMLRILEKLGQDRLQYWGFSYGSVLGQYFAAMYPHKVGRLVIDGVLDASEYATTHPVCLQHTDEIISSFYSYCAQAGPVKCPLHAPEPDTIRKRVESIMGDLARSPIPVPFGAEGPTVVTDYLLRNVMFRAVYQPITLFPVIADALVAIEARNATALADMPVFQGGVKCDCIASPPLPWTQPNPEAFYAIACGDKSQDLSANFDYTEYFKELTKLSPLFAPVFGTIGLSCENWKMPATWAYDGPFSAENTSHPLLVLSNAADPVTPLEHAQAVAKRFGGAKLVVQNCAGHCTLAAPSLCTAKHVRAYFANGTMPQDGATCEPDELPFVGKVRNDAQVLEEGDRELLETLTSLVKEIRLSGVGVF
ncbi:hypothetical protein HWV62_606 [Athelia sp. TMB]|nr:hypothetical protein HWV62_4237 [Athelia sp. TMB]KAF7978431.1 hypothetical protein HWV62_606 [Athelia sp. TMB]